MPRHPPNALTTLDRSHCQCSSCSIPKGSAHTVPLARSVRQSSTCSTRPIIAGIRCHLATKRPASRDRSDRAVRQHPSYAGDLSVSRDKSRRLAAHEVRTNLLFTMSYRTGGRAKKLAANLYTNDLPDDVHLYSTPYLFRSTPKGLVEPGGIEPTDPLLAKQVLSQLSYSP